MRALLVLLAALPASLVQAPAVGAQMHGTVGPHPAPLGCAVSITVSNDRPGSGSTTPCPWTVHDDTGALVFDPGCPDTAILMGPYGWVTSTWAQVDQAGQPVPPGRYWVRVTYDAGFGPPTLHPVDVGGTDAGLAHEGTVTIGQTLGGDVRNFYLCAPEDGGYPYLLLASLSTATGTPTCAGTLPLDPDPLLLLSAGGGTPFTAGSGTLAPDGTSKAPELPLPPSPALVGVAFTTAYVVLDLAAACPIRRISEPYATTVID